MIFFCILFEHTNLDPFRTRLGPPSGPLFPPLRSPGNVKSKISNVPGPPSDNSEGTISDILAHTLFQRRLESVRKCVCQNSNFLFRDKGKAAFAYRLKLSANESLSRSAPTMHPAAAVWAHGFKMTRKYSVYQV